MTIDLEAEYNNRARVPEHPAILAQLDIDAAAYRAASPMAQIGLIYGSSERQVIDMFPGNAGSGNAPLAMFIHGGYWRTNHWSSYSHIAKQLNARGVDVAIAGYDLCPQVTVAAIIDEMRAACLFLWRKRRQRMMVFGHSAGGHLAACMVATDWAKIESDAPADLVPAGYSISGLFDLAPMTKVSMNAELRLDDAEARRVSPLFWSVPPGRTFDAVAGGAESDEFRRQSRAVVDAWSGKAQTRYGEIAGANHFTVIDPLKDPGSAMVKRLVELAQTAT
jgi:arylformamidase